ncbi:hypothetical protein [Pengzhenrongella sp.]|jgi:hypothetical protein|uniref:hypothetical protein n=1 Tax=Pengzhenrongella sp. TaxID=2888820 RepID=UPI002F9267E5
MADDDADTLAPPTDPRLAGVLEELVRREPLFHHRELAADTYLLTYVLQQGDRRTRRSTLWQRAGNSWRALYHQGTVVL